MKYAQIFHHVSRQLRFRSPFAFTRLALPVRVLLTALILSGGLLLPAQSAQAATLNGNEAALLSQINIFRAGRGLPQVTVSDALTDAAKWMATDMAVNSYFSHTSLDGRSPFTRMSDFGYPVSSSYTGENLAAGQPTAASVLAGWINSPLHYAVLINPNYRVIGIGHAYSAGSTYGNYWAADFGSTSVSAVSDPVSADSGYHSSWSRQSPNVTLAPGQTTQLVLALKNTGYRGWYLNNLGQEARLGLTSPFDGTSPLAYNWFTPNRPTQQTTPYVGPGQEGWFAFTIVAPTTRGVYRLSVDGVIDGVRWLEDQGVFWTITVQ